MITYDSCDFSSVGNYYCSIGAIDWVFKDCCLDDRISRDDLLHIVQLLNDGDGNGHNVYEVRLIILLSNLAASMCDDDFIDFSHGSGFRFGSITDSFCEDVSNYRFDSE